MATTTITSCATTKSLKKEPCSFCKEQPFDLICTCGDKFDFICIQQHVEMIGSEFYNHYQEAGEKLVKLKDIKERPGDSNNNARRIIENWKRKRLQDVNEIADKALRDLSQQTNGLDDVGKLEEIYNDLSQHLHHIVHDTLDTVINLNQQIKAQLETKSNSSTSVINDGDLDAELQSKLNPSIFNSEQPRRSLSSSSSLTRRPAPETNNERSLSPSFERSTPKINGERSPSPSFERSASRTNAERSRSPSIERPAPAAYEEAPVASKSTSKVDNEYESRQRSSSPSRESERPVEEPPVELKNSNETFNDSTISQDDFEAGNTRFIDRRNPTIIEVNNDKYAATICSHDKHLLYNDYDKTTQTSQLIFIEDFRNPRSKQIIEWEYPDAAVNGDDDEWIQDIIYSNKLNGYLLLNRARLRFLSNDPTHLEEYHVFSNRKMKRLSSNDKFLYLTSSPVNIPSQGDEIILMNYKKEEQVCKTFRDIIPSRLNRGAGPLAGEISDLAVGDHDQVVIGYRLERRHEVGVCLFNVTNEGREWSCVKQLLLNDCWHSDLSYTPRIDWSEKIKNFILIEYITGHLIMVDHEGQVEGECRFMQPRNRQESPINVSISTDDYLCVRYQSSITLHKLI